MRKTVVVFGLLSGAVSAALMLLTVPFIDKIGFDRGVFVGYTAMVAAFILVFFGVRSYRDHVGHGSLSFGRGFTVGLLITLISCVCYVATWEVVYFKMMPDFAEKWGSYMVEQKRAAGASAAEIEATARQMADFKVMYDNPIYNAGFTFIEPLPVGLLVTLISAGVLRKRPRT